MSVVFDKPVSAVSEQQLLSEYNNNNNNNNNNNINLCKIKIFSLLLAFSQNALHCSGALLPVAPWVPTWIITYSTYNIGICLPPFPFVLGLNIPDLVVKLLPGLGKLPKNFSVFYHLARKCYPPQKRRYLGLTIYTEFVRLWKTWKVMEFYKFSFQAWKGMKCAW